MSSDTNMKGKIKKEVILKNKSKIWTKYNLKSNKRIWALGKKQTS